MLLNVSSDLNFGFPPNECYYLFVNGKKRKKFLVAYRSERQLDEFGIKLFAVTTHLHVIIKLADTAQYAGLLVKQENAFGTIFNDFSPIPPKFDLRCPPVYSFYWSFDNTSFRL